MYSFLQTKEGGEEEEEKKEERRRRHGNFPCSSGEKNLPRRSSSSSESRLKAHVGIRDTSGHLDFHESFIFDIVSDAHMQRDNVVKIVKKFLIGTSFFQNKIISITATPLLHFITLTTTL